MSEFPPKKWDVRFLQDMETLACGLQAGEDLAMEAFVPVRPARGEEGIFKFMLAGSSKLRLSFPINKVLPSPAFDNMVAKLELVPGDQIKLQKNSSATIWWDVEDLVSSQDVVITDGKRQDRGDDFLAAVGHNKELVQQSATRQGLCMRWMLGTRSGSKQVLLMAQVNKAREKLLYTYLTDNRYISHKC